MHFIKPVNESKSRFKCKISRKLENGKEYWSVDTIEDRHWIADFSKEEDAKKFAEQYPKMMEDYIAKAKQIKAENVHESSTELDAEAKKLKQYNGKQVAWKKVSKHIDDGDGESHIWLKSPNGVLVCRIDVKTYGRGEEDEPSGYYIVDKQNGKLVEVGHGYTNDTDRFIYAYTPNGVKPDIPDDVPTAEDEEAWIKEEELDKAIEESLSEIYK